MTDKQIIIDGVDVSKCKHYDKGFNYCDQSYLGEGGMLKNTKNPRHCEWLPNCYYKQLKRQERRCGMWESIAVDNGELALKYQQQLDQLKAERDSYIDKCLLESQKVINLKKVLIEIKEIAQGYEDTPNLECKQLCCTEVLQKFSEVEND